MSTGSTKPKRLFEAKLDFGSNYIKINHDGQINFNCVEPLSPNELSAVAILSDMLRCLRSGGKILEYNFDPVQMLEQKIVSLYWTENGYLKFREDNPCRTYMHAKTIGEALRRKGSFTCSAALFSMLPRKRTPEIVLAFRDEPRITTPEESSVTKAQGGSDATSP